MVNPYHVQVRHRKTLVSDYTKMSLQLYQVDYKSYLLDFKSLSSEEDTLAFALLGMNIRPTTHCCPTNFCDFITITIAYANCLRKEG